MKKANIIALIIVLILVGGGTVALVKKAKTPGQYDKLAQCIADSGAKFYGAFWCPHCQATKALFGKSAKLLPYVECSQPNGQGQLPICNEKGIKGYPTWIFSDGSQFSGEKTLEELANKTSCQSALAESNK